jgi:hypothetical protein
MPQFHRWWRRQHHQGGDSGLKELLLQKTRNVSFERVAMIIQNHEEIEVLENPVHIG